MVRHAFGAGERRRSSRQGTLFCQVGDPKKLEAVLVIDQADRNLILDGQHQPVDIKLEGFAGVTIPSEIAEVAESELKIAPRRLSNKSQGELATKTDPQTGVERPMSTSYQARAPIDDPERPISDRPARPGPRANPVDFPRLPPLAPAEPHVQFQAGIDAPSPLSLREWVRVRALHESVRYTMVLAVEAAGGSLGD